MGTYEHAQVCNSISNKRIRLRNNNSKAARNRQILQQRFVFHHVRVIMSNCAPIRTTEIVKYNNTRSTSPPPTLSQFQNTTNNIFFRCLCTINNNNTAIFIHFRKRKTKNNRREFHGLFRSEFINCGPRRQVAALVLVTQHSIRKKQR